MNPKNVGALVGLGWIRQMQGEFDTAVVDYSEALRINPKFIWAAVYRGECSRQLGEFARALADYDLVLAKTLGGNQPYALRGRGDVLLDLKRLDDALAAYQQAVDIEPRQATAYAGLAWFWATCPDKKYRNGSKAVDFAMIAWELEQKKDWSIIYVKSIDQAQYLETLAAAYAESGQFKVAVEWQSKAVELAPGFLREQAGERLQLYRKGLPYRHKSKSLDHAQLAKIAEELVPRPD